MTRGRKETNNSYNELLAIRITKSQKELLERNTWIKEEIIKQVREYMNVYLPEECKRK